MSGGNKCLNSASVHSQKKPKTSGLQPSKNANGPEKPRQVGHIQAYVRTFDASAEGAIPKEKVDWNLMTKNGLTFDSFMRALQEMQDSDVTMEYGEGDKGGDGDEGDEGDDMVIEDVTKENKNKNKQNGTRAKVLQSNLASDALAKISKQAVRKAICLLDMFPSDKMFAWEVLEEELILQQGDDNQILEDLRETKKDPQAPDKLLR
ncbi:hypothetical protein BDP27DRAFT_1425769 [Rhodocollybia butyracea]|uniref:Uncharacterized protein n=1 Tax=Rhodocollybia butyracea TaxID=206335 RepID=A0A9P5PIG9_9AGAR|nr:hypothetical protein BDP27DRAFT_1425769 [Rhodocollybia butyracea]